MFRCFQGCLANLSVNNQPSRDLLNEAAQTSHNQTNPNYVSMEDVVSGCLDRPTGAPRCPLQTSGQLLGGPELDGVSARFVNNAYCLNDGICLLMWSTLKCSCELTSFQGSRCSKSELASFPCDLESLVNTTVKRIFHLCPAVFL